MAFPVWATPGKNRKLYGKAIANGADELILSDVDATLGFLEGKAGKANNADFVLLLKHFVILLDDILLRFHSMNGHVI